MSETAKMICFIFDFRRDGNASDAVSDFSIVRRSRRDVWLRSRDLG